MNKVLTRTVFGSAAFSERGLVEARREQPKSIPLE